MKTCSVAHALKCCEELRILGKVPEDLKSVAKFAEPVEMQNGWELKEMLLTRFEDADDANDCEAGDTGELHNYSASSVLQSAGFAYSLLVVQSPYCACSGAMATCLVIKHIILMITF